MTVFKRKRTAWLLALFVALAGLGGYGLYAVYFVEPANARDSQSPAFQEAVARIGEIRLEASGSGELVPARQSELGFQKSGDLLELNVSIGDRVQTGDVLARLQVIKSPAQHQAEVTAAGLKVAQAEQSLESLHAQAGEKAAEALVELESAQQALEDLQDNQAEVAQARIGVASAQSAIDDLEMSLYILNSTPSEQAVAITYSSLLFKEKELNELYEDVERLTFQIKSAPNKMAWENLRARMLQLKVTLANKVLEVEKARYHYATMSDPADPLDLTLAEAQMNAARANLAAAEAELAQVESGPSQGELALAEARLAEAQAAWERWRAGPDPDELALAEAQLAEARIKLSTVEEEQLVLDLAAPFDGTVIAVNAAAGERISGGAVIVLADLDHAALDVYLDESDGTGIQPGDPADIVFDVLPEATFEGQVSAVAPELARAGNTDAVLVSVQVDDAGFPSSPVLPLGANASVDVIRAQASGAVLVPVEALYEMSPGEYGVYVKTGSGYELRPVRVGLTDFTSAEILDGLAAGETVASGDLASLGTSQ